MAVAVAVGVVALAVYGRFVADVPSVAQPPLVDTTPTVPETTAAPSPGCRRTGHERRSRFRLSTGRPARPIPFFAERVGSLPADGTPTVAGVRLPPGSRCAGRWVTDAPIADGPALARRLAAAFPETGLWPVLWNFEDDPDHYTDFWVDPSHPERRTAEEIMRRMRRDFLARYRAFDGLARGTGGVTAGDPFGTLAREWAAHPEGRPLPFLILVPTNRPADVVARLATVGSGVISDEALSVILRSWEERFGATVTATAPGSLEVAVAHPPSGAQDARRLAQEHQSFAPDSDRNAVRSRYWVFGWPD